MLPSSQRPFNFKKLVGAPARLLAVALPAALLAGCYTYPRFDTDLRMRDLVEASAAKGPAQASAAELPRLNAGTPVPAYRIGAQDELSITVWGPSDLWAAVSAQGGQASSQNAVVVVQDDGTIALPLVKPVAVDGLTLTEAVRKVGEAYRNVAGAKFQVDAKITRYHSKSVLLEGAVNKPGLVYLSPETATLGDVVGGAGGGLPETAEVTRGTLTRGGKRYALSYQNDGTAGDLHDVLLQPGDRIFFPSRTKGMFYVFGEVGLQGAYNIPAGGVTLLQGLSQAKGPQVMTAHMGRIFLVRMDDPEAPRIYMLSLEDILSTKDLMLAANDRLWVAPTDLAVWDRTVRQMIPVLTGALVVQSGTN